MIHFTYYFYLCCVYGTLSNISSWFMMLYGCFFFFSKTVVEWNFSLNRPSLYLHRHFYTICYNVDGSYTLYNMLSSNTRTYIFRSKNETVEESRDSSSIVLF